MHCSGSNLNFGDMATQLGRVTLNTAKVPAQMEKQRRRERLEEDIKESGADGNNSLMARVLAQVGFFRLLWLAGAEALNSANLSRRRACEIVGVQDGLISPF
jgi:hypothetical protein